MQSQIIKKVSICIIGNIILLVILINLPIGIQGLNLCVFKLITGKECINCGMTRAFLSILHFDFLNAYNYNSRVVIVFPLIVSLYIYWNYKFIRRGKNERKN